LVRASFAASCRSPAFTHRKRADDVLGAAGGVVQDFDVSPSGVFVWGNVFVSM
jgi:hypothetical protein